jgi:hypothetical protein
VCGGGEAEHYGQADASGCGPVPKVGHAQLPDQPSDNDDHDENDKRRHGFPVSSKSRLTYFAVKK